MVDDVGGEGLFVGCGGVFVVVFLLIGGGCFFVELVV